MYLGAAAIATVAFGFLFLRRSVARLAVLAVIPLVVLMYATTAGAAIVPTVLLGTASNYSVLGASTVTNTGGSILGASLGIWPGTSITGFPPGEVLAPGTTDTTNEAAQQAQSDLTAAYGDAAGRSVDATTAADLANLDLGPGVYSGPDESPLSLSGPLTLDGAGNSDSVFIFQTNSTLITGSSSTVTLINGAQACNVFWQVGSSATLGTNSVFAGNILALTSITVTNGVTVQGRALARNGAVTLDDDVFTSSSCVPATTVTTTTGSGSSTTTSGRIGSGTPSQNGNSGFTQVGGSAGTATVSGGSGSSVAGRGAGSTTAKGGSGSAAVVGPTPAPAAPIPPAASPPSGNTGRLGIVGPPLAFTGANLEMTVALGTALLAIGGLLVHFDRRRGQRRPRRHA